MVDVILYSSQTGSCKKYAQLISEATGKPAVEAKSYSRKKPRERAAYIGWLFAGKVMGLSKARKKAKIVAVCQVGMGPEKAGVDKIARKKNRLGKSVPVFYLQGAFHLKKLPFVLRLIMSKKIKSIASGLQKKASMTALNAQEIATLKMASTGSGEPASWDIKKVAGRLR